MGRSRRDGAFFIVCFGEGVPVGLKVFSALVAGTTDEHTTLSRLEL